MLLGAPGSGKGTVAVRLKEKYGIPHISTGDVVRAEIKAGTAFGKRVKEMTDKGQLMPDTPEYIGQLIDAVKVRLSQDDCKNGFILDGLPRTAWQASQLGLILGSMGRPLTAAVLLEVSHDTLMKRLTGRLTCTGCKVTYHQELQPPKVPGTCDKCCQKLYVRPDDTAAVALSRLEQYNNEIEPIVEFYKNDNRLMQLTGEGTPESVFTELSGRIEELRAPKRTSCWAAGLWKCFKS